MSLTDLLIPTYKTMLRTLAGRLDKAEQQMPHRAEDLLSAQLAPDMYPLSSQVRFAVYQAQEASFRLRGEAIPQSIGELAAEERNAGAVPGSLADARARLAETQAHLNSLTVNALDAGATLPISIELPRGVSFDMTGEESARDWALAQFYFHVVTAYAILRSQGVKIGKAHYMPHKSAYLRPGWMPSA